LNSFHLSGKWFALSDDVKRPFTGALQCRPRERYQQKCVRRPTPHLRIPYHRTLVGRNTGPGGTGKSVRISGFEEWTIGDDGLIAVSLGRFDQAEYDRQLEHGAGS
jgi:hypothetical protein